MSEPTCTHTAEGWATREHTRKCDTTDCRGCRPCSEDHCDVRGCAHHVNHQARLYTCPGCIGRARRRVNDILDRYAQLPAQAVVGGVDSEALNLHGPAADPEQYAVRQEWNAELDEAEAWRRGWCKFPRDLDDDKHHPLTVLGRWDVYVRDRYGPPTDLFVNLSRAADYLTGPILDTFAHTKEFEDFDTDTRRCLTHLETVLSDSRQPEKGAPCPTCRLTRPGKKAPRLEKHLAEHAGLKRGEVCKLGPKVDHQGRSLCRTCRGDDDTWHCPSNPEHHWTEGDYRARVDGDYVEQATALTADQAAERFGIKASVIRVWGSRGHVKKRGKNRDGITLYDVAQIQKRTQVDTDVLASTDATC